MEEQNHENNPGIGRRILKVIKWIFIVLILLAVLFFSFPYIMSVLWGKDSPPINDQDLLLSKVDIPRKENSYFDLMRLSRVVGGEPGEIEIEINFSKDLGVKDLDYLESYTWDESVVDNILGSNKGALDVFAGAAAKSYFQMDTTADPDNISQNMPIIAMNYWRQIARIAAIKSIYLMRQGDDEAAFNEAMNIIKVGHNIEKSRNSYLIAYLVGIAIKQSGLETMQLLISYSSASPEVLTQYQREIRKYKAVTNNDYLKTEYLSFKKAMETMANLSTDDAMQEFPADELTQKFAKHNYYFKLNQTLEMIAEHYRKQIERNTRPCSNRSEIDIDRPEMSWKLYFTENAVGELLSSMSMVALDNVRNKKCSIDVLLNATDVLFSFKKYYLENGAYPEKTGEQPTDPFSGKAFILDKDKMIIYSVGDDRIDKGGSTSDKYDMGEPTFSYDFAVKEQKKKESTIDLEEGADKAAIGDFNEEHEIIDEDGDLLPEELEKMWGTSDKLEDSDNDDFSDSAEIVKCYNPSGEGTMTGSYFTDTFCPAWWRFSLDYASADRDTYQKYISLVPKFCGYWSSYAEYFVSLIQSGGDSYDKSLDDDGDAYQKSCTAMLNDTELKEFMEYILEINVEQGGTPEAFCYFMSKTAQGMCGDSANGW